MNVEMTRPLLKSPQRVINHLFKLKNSQLQGRNFFFHSSLLHLMSLIPFSTQTSEADHQTEQCGSNGGKRRHFQVRC